MSLRKYHSGMMNTLISCGRTDQWSRYMTGGGYTDAVEIGNYKVETQEDKQDIRFLLWNPHRPCITMVFDKHDKIANIDSIEYSPECATDGIITFAMNLLKTSGATKVQLTDNSSVICEGKKIRLGLMYFFKTGQTWYEKYFGFHPESKYTAQYARAKTIQATLGLSEKPCDYFTDDVLEDLLVKTKLVFFQNIVWEKEF